LALAVVAASIQDRDCLPALSLMTSLWRSLEKAVFDGAFVATRCIEWCARLEMAHEMVKRSDLAGFVVLPKRWIVERNFAWLSLWNGLARDSVGRLDVAHRRFAAATAFAAAEALLNRLPASS
jgi:transposase